MSLILDGSSGTTGNLANGDLQVNGVTVGKGGGTVSTNTVVGSGTLNSNTTGASNTAVGYQAGYVSTGDQNTYIGQRAGYTQTSGTLNTYVGYNAGNGNSGANSYNTGIGSFCFSNLSTGANNVAIGYQSLQANTTASYNNSLGYQALFSNTTGAYNTAIGSLALYANTTQYYNTAVGHQAGYSNTTGGVTAVGTQVLYANTTGTNNVGMGGSDGGGAAPALRYNTTGSYNTAIGSAALASNTTAGYNTAVGSQALYSANRTSDANGYNTALGYQAGYSMTTGQGNQFIGQRSGFSVTTGTNNQFFGETSGYYVTTGSKNAILGGYNGNQGGLDIRTASNYIVLSDGDGNPRMYFNGGGQAYLSSTLQVGNDLNLVAGANFFCPNAYTSTNANAANVYIDSNGRIWRSTSSLKYKTNVQDAAHGLNDLLKLRSVTYKGKSEADGNKVYGGLIAEEVDAAGLTEFVQYAEDGSPDALAYGNMVSLCIKAIQEQQALITQLQSDVATLKGK